MVLAVFGDCVATSRGDAHLQSWWRHWDDRGTGHAGAHCPWWRLQRNVGGDTCGACSFKSAAAIQPISAWETRACRLSIDTRLGLSSSGWGKFQPLLTKGSCTSTSGRRDLDVTCRLSMSV